MGQASKYILYYILSNCKSVHDVINGHTKMAVLYKGIFFSHFFRYDFVTNHEGKQCMWEGDQLGWHVKETQEKCIKRIGYFQWLPYVLLLQVNITNNLNLPLVRYNI